MMKKNLFTLIAFSVVAVFTLLSCSKDSDEETEHKVIEDLLDEPTEIVVDRVMNATRITDYLFSTCENAIELESHREKIDSIEGLEYVEFNSQGMEIKLKNFLPISYIYPESEDMETGLKSVEESLSSRGQSDVGRTRSLNTNHVHQGNNLQTLCIVDQLSQDEDFGYVTSLVNDLAGNARKTGITVKVLRNSVLPSFFRNEIFNYDMLLILTHGGYNERNGTHRVYTSLHYGINLSQQDIGNIYEQMRRDYPSLNSNDYAIGCIMETHTRGNIKKEELHYYLAVTDTYIREGPNCYPDERFGKAIVFSASCKSTKGNRYLVDAYLEKGAACYMGYDEAQSIGVYGGHAFFSSILGGNTIGNSVSNLPDALRDQRRQKTNPKTGTTSSWTAHLTPYYNRNVKNVQDNCARCVVTHDIDIVDFESSYTNPAGVETQGLTILKGSARMLYAYENTYGFYFGKKEDLSDAVKTPELYLNVIGDTQKQHITYDVSKNEVFFWFIFDDGALMDGEEYYFCAYMIDKYGHYCYGDTKKFKATGLIKGELGLFELHGPVKSCTLERYGDDPITRTFDRDGFWLTYNGQSIKQFYDRGITRDMMGRIVKGEFDEAGTETFTYDARGRVVNYSYMYYDGGNSIDYYYADTGLLYYSEDEPLGMDAEYYSTDVYYYDNYKLDKQGNWISRYRRSDFSGITESRTITYYDEE